MPDLSALASHAYWKQYPDPLIHRVLCLIESIEERSQEEDPLFKAILNELGKALDQLEGIDLNKLELWGAFITICNHLKMTQTLRLLQAIDNAKPGSAAKLLMYAENNTQQSHDEAGFLLHRNLIFERLRLLARIFSEERLLLIRDALEGATDIT